MIAMPGPWLPEAAPGREPHAEALPAMPALTRLLRRGRRLPDAPDWRAGVMDALCLPAHGAAAAVAAHAVTTRPGACVCLAAPLHLVAGLSRVHLPPGGRLQPAPDEEQAWCAAFNAEFGGGGIALHIAAPGGGWLLEAPFAAAARDASPEMLTGAPLMRRAAASQDEKLLRRLAAESEMWLADHALNRSREARGEPPLNALWFWGGARTALLPAMQPLARIAARGMADAWLAGLAAHAAQPLHAAQDFDSAMAGLAAGRANITSPGATAGISALLVPAPDSNGPTRHYWQMIDEVWMAPAGHALQVRRIAGLRLQLGRSAWQWPARDAFAWLRRDRRHWWQITGEARA